LRLKLKFWDNGRRISMTKAYKILALSLLLSASAVSAAQAVVVQAVFEGKVSEVSEENTSAPGVVGMNAKFTIVFDTETVGAVLSSTPSSVILNSTSAATTPVSKVQITKPDLGLDFDRFPVLQQYDGLDPANPETLTTRVSVEDTSAGREFNFSIIGVDTNPSQSEGFQFRVLLDAARLPLSLSTTFSVDLAAGEGTGSEFYNYDDFGQRYGVAYTLDRVTFSVPSVTPVPVPAALPLLASGLGAIGMVARKRRRSRV
jgi:hypothetical protein